MKRVIILAGTVLCLTACQGQNLDTSNTISSESSQVEQESVLWSPEQELQLTDSMEKMEADDPYYPYTPDNNLDYAGVALPKDILVETKTDWIPALVIEGMKVEPITLTWYDANKGASESEDTYQVVSMYSNLTRENWPNFHIYLFTLKDGKPIVLHSAQTQGSSENYFKFEVATDPEITEMFDNIVNP
ncbi:protein of unknown function [Granulicatella balaenopterae]|uniref:DUF4767 domain-containing protein n=1 Tax=Granulicatella balaenopterae TaxID=137733 RepID=A0A1H9MD96_9LACT|nr:DUF4767 domain-containing protein [Granulicatella balaenopterae]SER21612.1 protein of unknown function [Granulicatella balaenopterae]